MGTGQASGWGAEGESPVKSGGGVVLADEMTTTAGAVECS